MLLQTASSFATHPWTRRRGVTLSSGLLAACWLTLGWLHAIAFLVVAGWRVDGYAASLQLFGLSPLVLLVLWSSIVTLRTAADAVAMPPAWVTAAYVAVLLVPSSAVAALGLIVYAGWIGLRSAPSARYAALCLGGLGACVLWQAVGQRLLATPLLVADTAAAEWLLGLFQHGLIRYGNVIVTPGGHRVVVLLACATSTALPVAVLAYAALTLRRARRPTRRWACAMVAMALAYCLLNVVRLALLASSAGAYVVAHGPLGANLFDAVSIGLVLLAARLATGTPTGTPRARPPASGVAAQPRPGPSLAGVRGAPGWGALLVALGLLAGLGLKASRYGAAEPPLEQAARQAVTDLLAPRGWSPVRTESLVAATGFRTTIFARAGCPGQLAVAVVGGAGESLATTVAALGGNVAFLDAGTLSSTPPRAPFWEVLRQTALHHFRLARDRPMPLLAIAPPPRVDAGPCAPPSAQTWARLGATLP